MRILEYDDEATQRLLAVYITPDIVAQRRDFLSAFDLKPGERVLDVGAGPGFLAAEMAEAVGYSGSVCGVDISEPLLKIARSQAKGKYEIEYLHGDATQLPFQDEEFDVVVSTQVLREAQRNPEAHRDLIVKVGGYSAYFTELGCEIQDEIIRRTEHGGRGGGCE